MGSNSTGIIPQPEIRTELQRDSANNGTYYGENPDRIIPDALNGAKRLATDAYNGATRLAGKAVDTVSNAVGGNSSSNSNSSNTNDDNDNETETSTNATGTTTTTTRNRRTGATSTNWGGLVGGGIGVLLAWLASSMFGGGIFGTIAFVLLGVMGFMMGRSFGARNLNGLFGGQNDGATNSRDGQGRGRAREQGDNDDRSAGNDRGDGEAPNRAANETPYRPVNMGMRAETVGERVAELNDKVDALNRITERQIGTGTYRSRAVAEAQRRVGNITMLRDQMVAVYHENMTPEESRAVSELYRNANEQLESLMSDRRNGPLRGLITAEIALARRGETGAAIPNPNARGRAFSGSNVSIGANLDPNARETVEGMRSNTNYSGQPAALDNREPPRFNAQTANSGQLYYRGTN